MRRIALLVLLALGCGEDADSSDSVDPSSTTQPPTTTAGGTPCGADQCAADEYCDWSANSCGDVEFDEGQCLARPDGCNKDLERVCGCDGIVYDNPCFGTRAGVDVDMDGQCDPPEGQAHCGFRFCEPESTYCQTSVSDVTPEPNQYTCIALPGDCVEPIDCVCVSGEPCYSPGCMVGAQGLIYLLCPGG